METPPENFELCLRRSATQLTAGVSHKAWHVLALLFHLGRPARPDELASECKLFNFTPDFIIFLCSIPNSPLQLTHTHSVTISHTGIAAVAHFFCNSDANTLQLPPRLLQNFTSGAILRTYSRKRKRLVPEMDGLSHRERTCYFQDSNGDNYYNRHGKTLGLDMGLFSLVKKKCYFQDFSEVKKLKLTVDPISQGAHSRHTQAYVMDGSMSTSLVKLPCASLFKTDPLEPDKTPPISSSFCLGLLEYEITTMNIKHGPNETGVSQQEKKDLDQACRLLTEYMNGKGDDLAFDSSRTRGQEKNQPMDTAPADKPPLRKLQIELNSVIPFTDGTEVSPGSRNEKLNHWGKSPFPKANQDLKNHLKKVICKTTQIGKCNDPCRGPKQFKSGKQQSLPNQKPMHDDEQDIIALRKREMHIENKKRAPSIAVDNHSEHKPFPEFESFTVDEEEGSGGYGTVYKARRKSDGVTFAIKCPHVNANKNHMNNELKMLERLGGKNFIIRYEGSFENGNADCLVLEHVQHDRPEVLKREINVSQLQWYGYCMFKALTLHKLGIVHRDVKPGNFLFSRKANKGYLIDFNLALDLHRKYGVSDNSKAGDTMNFEHTSLSGAKSIPAVKDKKLTNSRLTEAVNYNAGKGSRSLLSPGNLKKKASQTKAFIDSRGKNIVKSQGADGSGITSAMDATSTKTPSAERFREPLPSHGRKELISLVQESLQGGNHNPIKTPLSKRKRVAAPPANADRNFFYPTPMPLHATGMAISGGFIQKSNGKHKREGPCVGTKGFRAPEVLFRSLHQGTKVDIWSAGVTLLYLMIGRTPFVGDPEQNIKEIAKLRGSEELWEVAKLHNQESLFLTDLLDVKHLSPVKLGDWCARNTRRPDFLEILPKSLFDLVDRCLAVNPRLRISADEALRHEFFAPCHEVIRKLRIQRQGLSHDSATKLLHEDSKAHEVVS